MRASLTIEYTEGFDGQAEVMVTSETDPPGIDVPSTFYLGMLELAKQQVLLDWEQV